MPRPHAVNRPTQAWPVGAFAKPEAVAGRRIQRFCEPWFAEDKAKGRPARKWW